MKIIATETLQPGSQTHAEALFTYNGLDCCVTLELFEAIAPQLSNVTRATYEFEKELQGPVFDMSSRGVRVDQELRSRLIADYEKDLRTLEIQFERLLAEGLGFDLNWRSPHQLKELFYETMGITPITKMGKITVDRDALEKLRDRYFYARPVVVYLLAMRDLAKKISTLKSEVDADGRYRTAYNIAGTNTGRFSSSFNILGGGGNFQNWEERLRRPFVADKGMKFANVDGEQAESRAVGAIEWNLFADGRYLDACESGDLHTSVAKLAWPNLSWTGDLARDKEVAEQPFYRQHSYRHMAKVLGHGTNYNGQPYTMAQHTKIDTAVIKEFQRRYFEAFPAHKRWHQWVVETVKRDGYLVNLMGRRRWFFGRRDDASTHRGAIAFDPQGSVGDIINRGMLQVWRLGICEVLMQVHDSILVQYPEELEDEIVPQILKAFEVPVELRDGRILRIPSEAKVGWNWSNKSESNPDGLAKYKGSDTRRRTSHPSDNLLDQYVYGINDG